MARAYTIVATGQASRDDLTVHAGEALTLTLLWLEPGEATTLVISATPGGTPLVEVPGQDVLTVTAGQLAGLTEGRTYRYDLWRHGSATVVSHGELRVLPSIYPGGVITPPGSGGGLPTPGGAPAISAAPDNQIVVGPDGGLLVAPDIITKDW